jgi:hypothetical protein
MELELVKKPKIFLITFNLIKLFFDMWVRHHGMFQFIVNDRDAKYGKLLETFVLEGGNKIVFSYGIPPTN